MTTYSYHLVTILALVALLLPGCGGGADDTDPVGTDTVATVDLVEDSSTPADTEGPLPDTDVAVLTDTLPDTPPSDTIAEVEGEVTEEVGGEVVGDTLPEEIAEEVVVPPPFCFDDLCEASPDHAPDPSTWGPFPVGVMTTEIELVDTTGEPRVIRVEIWYPTTEAYRDGPFQDIIIYDDVPDDLKPVLEPYQDAVPPLPAKAVRDAPVRTEDGPYPLVLFSHGAYGVRFQSIFYTIVLASHGYVVAAPDHVGNTLYGIIADLDIDEGALLVSAMNRPLDITALLDYMLERNETEADLFAGTMDEEHIGATGHSFGGFTSFAVGFQDPRIDAVVAHAPLTGVLPLIGVDLGAFPVPAMIQAGTQDGTLDTQLEMRAAYDAMPAPKYYFELYDGGHFTYSNICMLDLVYLAEELGIKDAGNALDDGCADFNIPIDTAHPIIDQFAIGFFNYYLKGSTGSFQYFDDTAAAAYDEDLLYLYETE